MRIASAWEKQTISTDGVNMFFPANILTQKAGSLEGCLEQSAL